MAIPGSLFFNFVFSIQLKIRRWLHSNPKTLVSEATTLPNEPQFNQTGFDQQQKIFCCLYVMKQLNPNF